MLPSAHQRRKPKLTLSSLPTPRAAGGASAVEDTSLEAPFNPFGDAPACKSALLPPLCSNPCVVCLVPPEHLERLRAAAAGLPSTEYNVSEFVHQLTLRDQLAAAAAQGGDCLILSATGTIMDGARVLLAPPAQKIKCKKLTDHLSVQFSFLSCLK